MTFELINPDGEVTTDDFIEQFDIALGKTMKVVTEAGGDAEAIGRMTLFVTDLDAYRSGRQEIGKVYRSHMGRNFPAMALMDGLKRLFGHDHPAVSWARRTGLGLADRSGPLKRGLIERAMGLAGEVPLPAR